MTKSVQPQSPSQEFDGVIFHLIVEKKHGKYTLSSAHDGHGWAIWLYNQDGEGMSISSHDLYEIIDAYFRKYY